MKPLNKIFNITYPKTMVLNKQTIDPKGVAFISSKGTNNGISARIEENKLARKYEAGAITVSLKGTVLSAFLQIEDFYIAHQTAVLYPIEPMSDELKLFYCLCISANKYRYNYGRQADRTLKELEVPSRKEIPEWVFDVEIQDYEDFSEPYSNSKIPELNPSNWKPFSLNELFELKKGKRLTKANMTEGNFPFIGAIDKDNGYRQFIGQKPIHKANTITVNYNGNGVAEAFYQPKPFNCSDDVNVLYPKFQMNQYIALFLCTLIRLEKFRFNYGRKWHLERMKSSKIYLPINDEGNVDFEFMENYIKTLDYSKTV